MRTVIAGRDVFDKIASLKSDMVIKSAKVPGCFDSESLVSFQRHMSGQGYVEAHIVKSMYGYSVRYASGLQDFGILLASRGTDGSFKRAVEFSRQWQAADATRRYVTFNGDAIDAIDATITEIK